MVPERPVIALVPSLRFAAGGYESENRREEHFRLPARSSAAHQAATSSAVTWRLAWPGQSFPG
jgi:hypothetical protein